MTPLEILLLSAAAFCTSALTAVIGAGGGTVLTAIMLQVMSPAAAIPVYGVVQLASNTTRVWLLWKHMAWPVIFRFAVFMPLGVWLGLELFQGLPTEAIQILIGCFVLISLAVRQIGNGRESHVPLWAFFPIGPGVRRFWAGPLYVGDRLDACDGNHKLRPRCRALLDDGPFVAGRARDIDGRFLATHIRLVAETKSIRERRYADL